ncbi:hypothetical protein, partial [Pseudomonas aeruginosa]|uniref:hypothetical protein n=1 Tax=Pseudomonas aeruginosa TaxID=287 RepID=UPI001ABCA78D
HNVINQKVAQFFIGKVGEDSAARFRSIGPGGRKVSYRRGWGLKDMASYGQKPSMERAFGVGPAGLFCCGEPEVRFFAFRPRLS